MPTISITHTLGDRNHPSVTRCASGETLTVTVALRTAGGAAVDLTGESLVLGWARSDGTAPTATRRSGDATGVVSFTIVTAGVAAGDYVFDVWRETDTYEREQIVERSLVRMTTPVAPLNIGPTVTIAEIVPIVSVGTLAISGTAIDVDGTMTAASLAVTVNGVAQVAQFTYAAGAWSTSITLGTAGVKSIVVTATDSSGVAGSATRTTAARIIPTITMAAVTATMPQGTLAISGTVADDGSLTVGSLSVTVGGVAQAAAFSLTDGVWSTTVTCSTPGLTAVVVTVTDADGATAQASRSITVLQIPVVTIAPIATRDEGPVPFSIAIAPAPAGPVTVSLRIDGVATQDVTVTDGSGTGVTSTLTAGTHSFVGRYAWAAGGMNVDSAAVSVVVQNQLPAPAITSPLANARVAQGVLAVTINCPHPTALPEQLTVQVALSAGGPWTTAVYSGSGTVWGSNVTIAGEAIHQIHVRAFDATPGGTVVLGTPVNVSSVPAYVRATVTGATYSPVAERIDGSTETIIWTCEETAQALTGDAPTFNFGSVATRHVRMGVSNDALDHIRVLNNGFLDTDDYGRARIPATYNKAAEQAVAFEYLGNLIGMEWFMAANGSLAGHLDFTGCTALEHIECYRADVQQVTLTGCSSLIRFCFEGNNLTTPVDFNPVAATLQDVRLAVQQGGVLTLTPLTSSLAACWHFCTQSQRVVNLPTGAQLPVIEELWTWDNGGAGAYVMTSAAARNIRLQSESYTSPNRFTSVDVTSCAVASQVWLTNNALSTAAVDAVLAQVNAWGTNNVSCLLAGNSAPTAAGVANANAIISRGGTVTYRTDVGTGLDSDGFEAGTLAGNGWKDVWWGATGEVIAYGGGNALHLTHGQYSYRILANPGAGVVTSGLNYSCEVQIAPELFSLGDAFNFGLTIKWMYGEGIKINFVAAGTWRLGRASIHTDDSITRTVLHDLPASWMSGATVRTLKLSVYGTQVDVYCDGVHLCTGTTTINQNVPDTYYGLASAGGTHHIYPAITTATVNSAPLTND